MSERTKTSLAFVLMALVILGFGYWLYAGFSKMKYNWAWEILFCREECEFPFFYWFARSVMYTVVVSLAAWVIAFTLGSVFGVARTVNLPVVRAAATAYVELFRNVPLIVQMFLWFWIMPELVWDDAGRWLKRDLPFPEYWTAIVCLGMYHAARTAEQVRAGIQSIPVGQTHAGLAMGLTEPQLYRYILLPVSYRIIIPPLTSDFLGIFKNSSIALTIGVIEITAQARQVGEYTFNYIETLVAATVLYWLVTGTALFVMRFVEARAHIPGTISMHESASG